MRSHSPRPKRYFQNTKRSFELDKAMGLAIEPNSYLENLHQAMYQDYARKGDFKAMKRWEKEYIDRHRGTRGLNPFHITRKLDLNPCMKVMDKMLQQGLVLYTDTLSMPFGTPLGHNSEGFRSSN